MSAIKMHFWTRAFTLRQYDIVYMLNVHLNRPKVHLNRGHFYRDFDCSCQEQAATLLYRTQAAINRQCLQRHPVCKRARYHLNMLVL